MRRPPLTSFSLFSVAAVLALEHSTTNRCNSNCECPELLQGLENVTIASTKKEIAFFLLFFYVYFHLNYPSKSQGALSPAVVPPSDWHVLCI